MYRFVIWDSEDKLVHLMTDDYGKVLPYCTSATDARTLLATLEGMFCQPGFAVVHYNLADEDDHRVWGIILSEAETVCRWESGQFVLPQIYRTSFDARRNAR